MNKEDTFYVLNDRDIDPLRLKKERDKARQLKKSQAWLNQVNVGLCHYCGQKFSPAQLTMDHIVPLARGGISRLGNVVPACKACNRDKQLDTPVDQIFKQWAKNSTPSGE